MGGNLEEAVKFHLEFRLTLIQCKAKFEWNLDRAHSWAIAMELSWNYLGTMQELTFYIMFARLFTAGSSDSLCA